jgi:hypothetical protein
MSTELTPAQLHVLELIGSRPDDHPDFDPQLRLLLRSRLEAGVRVSLPQLADDQVIFVNKHALNMVHGCEARYVAEQKQKFEPTLPMVIGTVVHKAIELSIHWQGEVVPAAIVNDAIAVLEYGDSWTTDFIQTRSEREKAELRSEAVERFASFVETFPPLKQGWRPVTESRVTLELLDGRIILRGKVDLTLGHPHGNTAGKVLIDFKTGRYFSSHIDDLRFYGLLEAIKTGVPPRMLASFYLDQGELHPESVTIHALDSAEARLADGIRKMIDLQTEEREAIKVTGPPCRWCPVSATCSEGGAYLASDGDY